MFEGGLYGRVVESVLVEVESRSGVKADVDEPGPEVDVDAIETAPEPEVVFSQVSNFHLPILSSMLCSS